MLDAKSYATINGLRYCHGSKKPSCYELESHEQILKMSNSSSPWKRLLNLF